DLIENQLSKGNMEVYNMLNTKYFIVPNPGTGKPVAQINAGAFGTVWLVKSIKYVPNADAEMSALDHTSLKDTAIVQEQFHGKIKTSPVFDSSASIKLIENINDKISYSFQAKSDQFAVFSEIYYPLGWNAYMDDKQVDYVKTDYALRGMLVPAGSHKIEFRFEPKSFYTGDMITQVCGYLSLLLLAAAIFFEVKKRKPVQAKSK
ncbi:MAG: YfhO family protein, partial [Flavisolibacter sp.]